MSMEAMTKKLAWPMGQDKSYEEIIFDMTDDLHGEINIGSELI